MSREVTALKYASEEITGDPDIMSKAVCRCPPKEASKKRKERLSLAQGKIGTSGKGPCKECHKMTRTLLDAKKGTLEVILKRKLL